MYLPEGLESVMISAEDIQKRVAELARQISDDYGQGAPVVVGLLKGSFIFMADLVRALTIPVELDFLTVSSYGNSMESTEVHILKDITTAVHGRPVLIVEDIIDTGLTLKKIIEIFQGRGVSSLKIATLLNKPSRRKVEVPVDYNGFDIPDHFVVGYGLDFAQKYRQLPYIGLVKQP